MKTSVFVVALLLGSVIGMKKYGDEPCRKKSTRTITHVLKAPLTQVDLPEQWVWNNVNNVNYLTNLRN